jgi:hypothetical protein
MVFAASSPGAEEPIEHDVDLPAAEVDGAYRSLLRLGYVGAFPHALARGASGVERERRWRAEQAEPFWRALVARASLDETTIRCFCGHGVDEYIETPPKISACAVLLHPHTGQTLSDHAPRKRFRQEQEPMIETWRRLVGEPSLHAPSPERDLDADYDQLLDRGLVLGPSFVRFSGGPLRRRRWRAAGRWERREAIPWWVAHVARARAQGQTLYSRVEHGISDGVLDGRMQARCDLLDSEMGVALSERERLAVDFYWPGDAPPIEELEQSQLR